MRFPSINDHPLRKVSVPQLSGGVNKTDAPTYVNDNQLTDCNNMWFEGGRLRTRPGIKEHSGDFSIGDVEIIQANVKDDSLYILTADRVLKLQYSDDGIITGTGARIDNGDGFVAQIDDTQKVTIIRGDNNYPICIYDAESDRLDEDNGFIPTVKINVNASSSFAMPNGYMYQGFNLLNNSYKISCNTDGYSWAWVLPVVAKIQKIKIEFYETKTGEKQEANIVSGQNTIEGRTTSNEVYVTVEKVGGAETKKARFVYIQEHNAVAVQVKYGDVFTMDTGIITSQKNGLEITVICDNNSENINKIASMKIARWFGGARGGLENGTRLFVAGGAESGIIRWSDLNNPTYFSENNYAYVGDSSEITALAQQDDMLVIFQNQAISYATYVEGIEYTTDDVMNDRVVDVTTLSARFPITSIHSEIGCDCPATVRLCNNRLVWLTSAGKVYCLVNNNQYNERNVREISYAIEKMLKRHTAAELKSAKSADVDGKYILFVADKMYVLDYANTNFEYYTSNAHEKKLKNYLSWYEWTMPDVVHKVSAVERLGNRLCIIADTNAASGGVLEFNFKNIETNDLYYVTVDGNPFTLFSAPIPCSFRTKLFAFSGDERMKRIPNCNIALCKIPGDVEVSFVTDNGSGTAHYISIDEAVDESKPDAVKRMTLYPNANCTCLFGIEMQSKSAMAVEGVSISYKEMRDRQ